MRPSLRLPFMLLAIMVVFSLAVSSYGHKPATDAEATAAIANGQTGFNNPVVPFNTNQIQSTNSRWGPIQFLTPQRAQWKEPAADRPASTPPLEKRKRGMTTIW